MNRIRKKRIVSCVFVSMVVAPSFYYWYQLPVRTWENFLVALEQGDIASANSYCDQSSIKIEARPGEIPDFQIFVKPEGDSNWMSWFLVKPEDLQTKYYGLRASSAAKRVLGEVLVGRPGSVMFGQFKIHRNKIRFVSKINERID